MNTRAQPMVTRALLFEAKTAGHAPRAAPRRARHPVQRLQRLVGNRAVEPLLRDGATAAGALHQPQRVLHAAARGITGAGTALPHADVIQRAFGHHDVTRVRAHVDAHAAHAAMSIDAEAYAFGEHVAFGRTPSLRTAAHEAAHVVQQRAGIQLDGGVGTVGDAHECHADAVAERVVTGRSAAALLDAYGGTAAHAPTRAVQRLLFVAGREIKPGKVGQELEAARKGGEISDGGDPQAVLARLQAEAGEKKNVLRYTNWQAAFDGTTTLHGILPLTMAKSDEDIVKRLDAPLLNLFNTNKAKNKCNLPDNWFDEIKAIAAQAIVFKDRGLMLNLARRLKQDLRLPMPMTGALWSDANVGMVKAREELNLQAGKVLADTRLGEVGSDFKLSPQGATSKAGVVTEPLEEYQQRNAGALLFWGALSAVYAEGLKGTVHVWLPKGLTMGSIMWNDELPALRASQEAGEVTAIKYHVKTAAGAWSGDMEFDDLTIVDAYLADASGDLAKGDGVNKGGLSLYDFKHAAGAVAPSKGAERLAKVDEGKIAATLDKNYYHLELKTPINVGRLKAALAGAVERWRAVSMARAISSKEGNAKELLEQYRRRSQARSEEPTKGK